MSISLAIDTSTDKTLVGIVDGHSLRWNSEHLGATEHGPALADLVKVALSTTHIDRVVVGMGPGPYTGLRAGIAFARALAFARDLPVVGVCSLDAIAAQIEESDFIVATDAKRKEIYWARYLKGERVDQPAVNSPDVVKKFSIPIIENLYPDLLALVELSEHHNIEQPFYLRRPDAVPTAERK